MSEEKIAQDNSEVADFARTDKWKLVKDKLIAKLIEYNSVLGIDASGKQNEELGKEVGRRQDVVQIIADWISDIEGIKNQSEMMNSVKNPNKGIYNIDT